jgi:hypothetical protein
MHRTPKLGIPYPEGTDSVRSTHAIMEEAAEIISTHEHPVFTDRDAMLSDMQQKIDDLVLELNRSVLAVRAGVIRLMVANQDQGGIDLIGDEATGLNYEFAIIAGYTSTSRANSATTQGVNQATIWTVPRRFALHSTKPDSSI